MPAKFKPVTMIGMALLGAVLIAAAFLGLRDDGQDEDKRGLLLPVIHMASEKLTGIKITNRQDQIVLNAVKKTDGWYTDRSEKIDIMRLAALVQKLANSRIVEAMTGLAPNYGEYGVNPPGSDYGSAIKVVLYAQDGYTREVYLGYTDDVSGKHYARVDKDMMVYLLDTRVPLYETGKDWVAQPDS